MNEWPKHIWIWKNLVLILNSVWTWRVKYGSLFEHLCVDKHVEPYICKWTCRSISIFHFQSIVHGLMLNIFPGTCNSINSKKIDSLEINLFSTLFEPIGLLKKGISVCNHFLGSVFLIYLKPSKDSTFQIDFTVWRLVDPSLNTMIVLKVIIDDQVSIDICPVIHVLLFNWR